MCHNVKSTILLWTDVINYDYVNYVINVWCKKTITWWCTKKTLYIMWHNIRKYDVQNKMYIMWHNVINYAEK